MTATGLLSVCLLGSTYSTRSSLLIGPLVKETLAAFRDTGTQWMVLACCLMYFVTIILLEQRSTGSRFWRLDSANLWLSTFVVLVALRYAFDYGSASNNLNALVLLAGAVLGKGATVWAGWGRRQNSEVGSQNSKEGISQTPMNHERHLNSDESRAGIEPPTSKMPPTPPDAERESEGRERGRFIMVLMLLLVAAVFLKSETGMRFQYRGQDRWSGPWGNPNVFGMLMGVGLTLAVCQLVRSLVFKVQRPDQKSEVRNQKSERLRWLSIAFFVVVAGTLATGLLKSYSRGAWLAVLCALSYLGFEAVRNSLFQEARAVQWIRRNGVSLGVLVCALALLTFWNFRHTERAAIRRTFSVGNVNDFSWRNRVAAYEDAMHIMADKPWFGFGWNQPQSVYPQFYQPPKLAEGMAIQLNDYFMLGMTLGLPALLCFVIYVWLSFSRAARAESRGTPGEVEACVSYSELAEGEWLRVTCRAGAVVLLVGFWFDGGLFRLATAAPFWILLELGTRDLNKD